MLEYDKIYILDWTEIIKTNPSKDCKIPHYWYFKDIGFKYEPYLYNGCHGLMQKAISFNDVAIVYVKGSAYRIHFWYMSRDDATSIMNKFNLIYKMGDNFIILFSLCIKNEQHNLLSKNQRRDTK